MGNKSIRVLVVPPLGVPPEEASWEPESWPPRGPLDVLFITPDLERDQMCGVGRRHLTKQRAADSNQCRLQNHGKSDSVGNTHSDGPGREEARTEAGRKQSFVLLQPRRAMESAFQLVPEHTGGRSPPTNHAGGKLQPFALAGFWVCLWVTEWAGVSRRQGRRQGHITWTNQSAFLGQRHL